MFTGLGDNIWFGFGFSLSDACFLPLSLLPPSNSEESHGCVFPRGKFSMDLFPGLCSWHVPKVCMLMVEAKIMGRVGRRTVWGQDLCGPIGVKSERKEISQQICCYRAKNEIWGIRFEGAEVEVWTCLLPICFSVRSSPWVVSKGCLLGLETVKEQLVEGRRLRDGGGRKRSCHGCPSAELEMS